MKKRKYSKSQWFALTSAINFQNNKIKLKYLNENLDLEYLRTNYLKNISIFTFWGLYFPFISFLVLTSVIMWLELYSKNIVNLLSLTQKQFLIFLMFLFLGISLALGYKIFIKKQRCLYTKVKNNYRYIFITKSEINYHLQIFDSLIKQHLKE